MSKIKIIFFFILLYNLFIINNLSADKIEILYKVENYPITNKDISKEINYLIMLNDKLREISEKELIQYATRSIIKEKVKKYEILKNLNFGESEEIVKEQLNFLRKNLNLNQEEFNKLIDQLGITKTYLKDKIEVEILWNRLIYSIYKDKVNVNRASIEEKLKIDFNNSSNFLDEFLLHEILYSSIKKSDIQNNKIKIDKSIQEIGFENTANIYSESDSSKFGGKIGWVKENQLTKEILTNIKNLKIGQYTNSIRVPGGMLILFLKDKRTSKLELSFEEELEKIINSERNRQLDQYSSIYYKKAEINTKIYEN